MIKSKKPIGINAVKEALAEAKEKEEQGRLKEKYNIKDDNTYIVEKKTLTKFLIETFIGTLKVIFGIISIGLSTIGILTLIYEKPRNEIFTILIEIYSEVMASIS